MTNREFYEFAIENGAGKTLLRILLGNSCVKCRCLNMFKRRYCFACNFFLHVHLLIFRIK